MENLAYNVESLFEEVLRRADEEGASSDEAAHDIIDGLLEDRQDVGEMSDQDDVERIREELRLRWSERQHREVE